MPAARQRLVGGILILLLLVAGSPAAQTRTETPSAPAANAEPGRSNKPAASNKPGLKPKPGGQGEDPASSASPMKLITKEKEAASEFEKRAQYLLKKAEYHFFNKRFHTSLRFLKQLKEHDPENYLAYAYSGDVYLTHEKLELALESYQVAIELSPDPARERFRMGQIYYLKEEPEKALEFFERALKNKPDFPLVHLYMGLVYLNQLQDKPKAIEHLSAYKNAAPDDPQAAQITELLRTLKGQAGGTAKPAAKPSKPAKSAKPAGPSAK